MADPEPPALRGDRPYTVRVTLLSLLVGVPIAAVLGAMFYSVNRPVTQTAGGQVNVTLGALGFPVALLISGVVLALAVFWLPMRLARRSQRVLDPGIYPMMGVICVAALLVAAFVLGMSLGII